MQANSLLSLTRINHIDGDFSTCIIYRNFAIIGSGSVLSIIDCSELNNVNQVNLMDFQSEIQDITLHDTSIYVACYDDNREIAKISIADISNPYKPLLINSQEAVIRPTQIIFHNRNVYISDSWSGLHIFSLSHSKEIQYDSNYAIESGGWGVAIKTDLAYIAGGLGGLYVVDISNAMDPFLFRNYTELEEVYGIDISDQYIYIAANKEGLCVLDVNDQNSFVLVGRYVTEKINTGHVAVVNNIAFIAGCPDIDIVDVSDPAKMRKLGNYHPGTFGAALTNRVVLILRPTGIDIVEVTF